MKAMGQMDIRIEQQLNRKVTEASPSTDGRFTASMPVVSAQSQMKSVAIRANIHFFIVSDDMNVTIKQILSLSEVSWKCHEFYFSHRLLGSKIWFQKYCKIIFLELFCGVNYGLHVTILILFHVILLPHSYHT